MGKLNKYHGIVLLSALSWSSLAVFSQLLTYQHVDAFTQVLWRLTFGATVAGIALVVFKQQIRFKKENISCLFINSLLFLGAYTTFSLAVFLGTPIAKVLALNYAYPLAVVILSYLLFKDLPTRKQFIAITLSVISILLLLEAWNIHGFSQIRVSDFFAYINSFFFAGMIVYGKKIKTDTKLNPLQIMFITLLLTIPELFILAFFIHVPQFLPIINPHLATASWITLLCIGSFSTVLPVVLLYIGISHIKANVASVLLLTEPVWVYIFGFLLFHQLLSIWGFLGMLGVLVSVLLV